MHQAPRHAVTVPVDTAGVPERTCVGCRRTRPKPQLLRLVATPNTIRWDQRQRLSGRGAYVCPTPQCVDAAARRDGHAVRQALRGGHPEHVAVALDTAMTHATGRSSKDGRHHEEHIA